MARWIPAASLFVATSLALASRAAAQPVPANCTLPPVIILVEKPGDSSAPDPLGAFQVIVRGAGNFPIPNSTVEINFTACGQTYLAAEQDPSFGYTLDPCLRSIRATTNALGVARFNLLGATTARVAGTQAARCATISADNVPIGTAPVAAFDEDGFNGLRGSDFELLLRDYANINNSPNVQERSDFNASGRTDLTDISTWANAYFANGSKYPARRCDGLSGFTGQDIQPGGVFLGAQILVNATTKGLCRGAGGLGTVNPCGNTIRILGSATPPVALNAVTGFEAEVEVVGPVGQPLPPFWQVQPGGCSEINFAGSSVPSFTPGGNGCAAGYFGQPVFAISVTYPAADQNRELIRIVGAGFTGPGPKGLAAGTEYIFFGLDIADDGSCVGCNVNVAMKLNWLRINQAAAGTFSAPEGTASAQRVATQADDDLLLLASSNYEQSTVYANGVPGGYIVTGVDPGSRRHGTWLAANEPNPASAGARFHYRLAEPGPVRLVLLDVAGRSVRVLDAGPRSVGEHEVRWDGRDEGGASLRSGFYFCRLETSAGSYSRPLIVRR